MEEFAMPVFYLPIIIFDALFEMQEYQVARAPIAPEEGPQ
jgi:hypothetical protein